MAIKDNFSYKEIIKLNSFNPFYEKVIAYPAIVTMQNTKNMETYYYIANSIESLKFTNVRKSEKKIKRIGNEGELVFSDVDVSFLTIEEQGFKIGIGVASGADKIFVINKENCDIENEVLVPLITRTDVKEKIEWKNNYIINPFDNNTNNLIDLTMYPILEKYLFENKDKLMRRHIAKKNSKYWYRTIDKINIDIINKPKLLIPDISSKNIIYFDEGCFYPHHNFYYILGDDLSSLLALRALLSTKFVENQIKEKCTLMNGGALRRQAQTLRKIKIPNIQLISNEIKSKIIKNYNDGNIGNNELIINSFV